ncbi:MULTISPECIES: YcjF family protein [unclassified Adlercreutzia]|uniref:YcjF family protein n=1 Tax=unclassified Adlercreutzia TaxID=2636013 RepID=UPI0013EC95F5|nr:MULTISPECIES: hypothetical protein [unclassified Adlercreutzia]
MQLPVDIPAVIKAATDIETATKTPLAVSVFIDDTAPGDVVGHVRSAFASAGRHTRVTISYLDERPVVPYEADDMAVIVAGTSDFIGAQAARLREAGIPVMVATTMPSLVRDMAEAFGAPIPEGDVVSPVRASSRVGEVAGKLAARVGLRAAGEGAGAASPEGAAGPDAAAAAEPYELDDEAASALDRRMGEWIIAACSQKKLAFALAFPFVRRPLSIDAVNATALQNGAVGLVLIIPGADMPVMTLNQAKMLLQIAAAYGCPLNGERIKELAAVVGGAFFCRNVARSVAGAVPVLGWAVRAGVGYAGTVAMGRAAIEYFEAGGDIVGFASVVQKARDEAVDVASAAAATPAGQRALGVAKDAAQAAFARLRAQ